MPSDLKARLLRIQGMKEAAKPSPGESKKVSSGIDYSAPFLAKDWKPAGFQTVKRGLAAGVPFFFPKQFTAAISVVIPDFAGTAPAPEELLFFDLETTGLSGGAGTVAFLAAFGRFLPAAKGFLLHITQYLLLDYPGEGDFLEALLAEFRDTRLCLVSYNGKSFDSQILKTRFLMNRIAPPEYRHADLLHPARRLWKRILGECSQAAVETRILGIDRDGDIPGSQAPEIWFSFLKTGGSKQLMEICEHNRRDIQGLAVLLQAMHIIADDPCAALSAFQFDIEQLALHWRNILSRYAHLYPDSLHETGQRLLKTAAAQNFPRAGLLYARELLKSGGYSEGRRRLAKLAGSELPAAIRLQAMRTLAIDSEWRLADVDGAYRLAREALELSAGTGAAAQIECKRRLERLEKKLRGKVG